MGITERFGRKPHESRSPLPPGVTDINVNRDHGSSFDDPDAQARRKRGADRLRNNNRWIPKR